jgi:formamidopyrimidine-DNA glycosylase
LDLLPVVKELGLDLWKARAGPSELKARLLSSRQPIKVALMDQARFAGLGNLHAAEALFRAKLHPSKKPGSLSEDDWKRLAKAIRETLSFGVRTTEADEVHYVEEGGEVENPFFVYGRAGEPCRRCKTPIKKLPQAGRTTYYCPKCQQRKRG